MPLGPYMSVDKESIPPMGSAKAVQRVKFSLKRYEILLLLQFLDGIKTTRRQWQELDVIRSRLYKAYTKK